MDDSAQVEFCGEVYPVRPSEPVIVGRDGDIVIDDNPYLHRRFLEIADHDSMVWIANVGAQLSATVADASGLMQAWLKPGARLPLVFDTTAVWFTAGPTTYEFEIVLAEPRFAPAATSSGTDGDTTIGRVSLTVDQRRLVVALAEQILRRGDRGSGAIPSSADAARRLGWPITKFNRKLDNVCEKLTRIGVRGLHGSTGQLASNRRARLVEYAIAVRLVDAGDLALLLPAESEPRPEY